MTNSPASFAVSCHLCLSHDEFLQPTSIKGAGKTNTVPLSSDINQSSSAGFHRATAISISRDLTPEVLLPDSHKSPLCYLGSFALVQRTLAMHKLRCKVILLQALSISVFPDSLQKGLMIQVTLQDIVQLGLFLISTLKEWINSTY